MSYSREIRFLCRRSVVLAEEGSEPKDGFAGTAARWFGLLGLVAAAARGDSVLSPSVASRLVRKMREKPEEALTTREVEVLSLMAKAKGNKEIARELYLSEDTVKTHVKNVYQKLGATDRVDAVLIALKRRIVTLDA